MYGLPQNVRVVPVIPVYIHVFLTYVCLCFCMSEVLSSCKSMAAGSQVFGLIVLFLWVILHTMWSGKSLQLLCFLPFGMVEGMSVVVNVMLSLMNVMRPYFLVQPIGALCSEVMYFGCFGFSGELGFLNCEYIGKCRE